MNKKISKITATALAVLTVAGSGAVLGTMVNNDAFVSPTVNALTTTDSNSNTGGGAGCPAGKIRRTTIINPGSKNETYDVDYVIYRNRSYIRQINLKNKDIKELTIPYLIDNQPVAYIDAYAIRNAKSTLTSVKIQNENYIQINAHAFAKASTKTGPSSSHNIKTLFINYDFDVVNVRISNDKTSRSVTDKQSFGDSSKSSKGLENLTTVSLGSSVKSIPANAFSSLKSLKTVTVNKDPETKSTSLRTINEQAFYNCQLLKTIGGFEDVTTVKTFGFSDCKSLTNIKMPSLVNIGSRAFQNCSSLSEITISEDAKTISPHTFYRCTALKNVIGLENVARVSQGAFRDCISLETITLPSAINLDTYAFEGCSKLTNITIRSARRIEANAFSGCTSLKEVNTSNKLGYIGNYAFSSCGNFAKISDTSNVSTVGQGAFMGSGIETISLDNVNLLNSYAFYNCANLKKVSLSKVSNLGNSCFRNCRNLTSVTLSSNLRTIPQQAFAIDRKYDKKDSNGKVVKDEYPSGFNYSEKLIIHNADGVTMIGAAAFTGNRRLQTINSSGNNFPNVRDVSNQAFYRCSRLSSVNLPKAYNLSDYAFRECTNLENVTLGKVSTVPKDCFYKCSKLSSFETIGSDGSSTASVTTVRNNAFGGCSKLRTFDFNNVNTIEEKAFYRAFTDDNSATSFSVANKNVSVGKYAFAETKLKTVSMPKVSTINDYAFKDCPYLTKVISSTDDGKSSLSKIGNRAFYNDTKLQRISSMSNVNNISDYAFYNCTEFLGTGTSGSTVDMPSLSNIGVGAFRQCSNITTVNMPRCRTMAIDDKKNGNTFYKCTSLKTVDAASLSNIPAYAFAYCSNMKHMSCKNVSSIADYAFYNHKNRSSLKICVSLSNLRRLTSPTSPSCGKLAFYNGGEKKSAAADWIEVILSDIAQCKSAPCKK